MFLLQIYGVFFVEGRFRHTALLLARHLVFMLAMTPTSSQSLFVSRRFLSKPGDVLMNAFSSLKDTDLKQ